MSSPLKRVVALALGLGALAACSTERGISSSQPVAATSPASADLLGVEALAGSLIPVTGLQRNTPLSQPISVSATIGASGGVLLIPGAGVAVLVPSGALVAPTTITMTARAGSLVAYDFAPHGLTFAAPLRIVQSLSGTNANPLTALAFQLGYYADPSQLTSTGALVSELIDGTVDLRSWTFSSKISHFSGYAVSCGRQ